MKLNEIHFTPEVRQNTDIDGVEIEEDTMAEEKDFVFTTIKLRKEDKAALEQQAKEEGIPFGRHCGKVLETTLKNRAAPPAA